MVKLLLIICILMAGYTIPAQNVVVKKSSDIVVIRGVSYYLHVIEEGQTLYSICKAYGVDMDKVREMNGKKDNTLSLMEVLKIPYTEPYVSQDKDYYYHKVKKGETLYSISRTFGIKVKQILKYNEQYDGTASLPIAAIVRLPLKEVDMAAVRAEKASGTDIHEEYPVAQVKQLTENHITKTEEIKTEKAAEKKILPEVVKAAKPVEVKKEEPKNEHAIVAVHERENTEKAENHVPEYLSGVMLTENQPVKVALLLPFYGKERATNRILSKAEPFIQFYEGILLAVDSLKNRGVNVDLHVYDTERDVQKVVRIAEELNILNPDLIIGPVYGSTFKAVIDNLQNRNIPVVYPLSNRMENLGSYPNFVQVNASFTTLADEMAKWLSVQSEQANIINIRLAENNKKDEQIVASKAEKKIFTDKTSNLKGINYFNWNFDREPLAALKEILNPHKENIIILPTSSEAEVSKILPSLSMYAGKYPITVIGFPEWQTFTSVDHETYFKLNVKLLGYSYIDYSTEKAKRFSTNFRRYFYTEPTNLANKAYDIGLYFIGLAAKYHDRTLDALNYFPQDGVFSRFSFSTIENGQGRENKGLYIINYGSDYQLKITPLH